MIRALWPANAPPDLKLLVVLEMAPLQGEGSAWFLHPFVLVRWENGPASYSYNYSADHSTAMQPGQLSCTWHVLNMPAHPTFSFGVIWLRPHDISWCNLFLRYVLCASKRHHWKAQLAAGRGCTALTIPEWVTWIYRKLWLLGAPCY